MHVTTVPGSLTFFHGQVGYLNARGMDVWALSSPGELLDQFAAREGVRVHGLEMPRRITPLRDMATIARLWRWLREVRPDIVNAHTPKGGLLGMVAAWLARVPVRVYHMHGLPLMTATGLKRRLLRWAEMVSCLLAHQVFCVSASLREAAVAEGLCRPDKMMVLHHGSINGVSADRVFNPAGVGATVRADARGRYGIPLDAEVVGFVGRVVRDKGLVELVEAWQTLRVERPELHMLVVGPFEPQDPLPPDAERLLRTDPRVHLTGINWDTPPLFAAMDVFVLPTYREGLPVSPLEAAAMELPVVATEVPGCVDAVQDGVTGTLVPPRDAAALTEAIRRYLIDPELRRRHGRSGRERVLKEFRQEDVWAALHVEYMRLLDLRHHAQSLVYTEGP
ncbi:glycosyltransferase family 4 protein [Mycobacterium sp. URHB0044]|uniref:glycosyltransferase family 4 protein n=1 Tax=Mycobacterium sp. URHB0044 TaxID=1380386 RepID=UPI000B22D37B|nr:glycosyltransferase family 4 protein [Mycobacterium sp. URHB0044]